MIYMKNSIRGIRGIDAKLFEKFKEKVRALHNGRLRGKHSYVAEELNYLMQIFIETNGRVSKHKVLPTRKEQILRETIEILEHEIKHPTDPVQDPALIEAIAKSAASHRLFPDQRTLKQYGVVVKQTLLEKDDHGFYYLPAREKLEISYPSMFGWSHARHWPQIASLYYSYIPLLVL